ncbi:uncharacterized protein LOC114306497 [Camellia sinensis]|uniref:uncharacterized protein LOC114306497 n=1 Tax=Camellia sinensis TaxID=4442 RepID=UPI0010356186|nr:uncharacterized protein LOC114306497 [Camellia sinensis]
MESRILLCMAPTNPNVAEPLATDPQLGPNVETENYFKLLENAQSELYPGCQKFTSLTFIVRLLHMKVLNQWSDTSVTMLLELLNEAFPEGAKLPDSYYQAQKITTDLGFTYETWDVCPNSCMLFRNEYMNLDECVICKSSRWKQNGADSSNVPRGGGKQISSKQMRYFPLKQRLQRLYMSSKTAKLMKWHAEEWQDDGVLRHPADSLAWKDFDRQNTDFADDCRSLCYGQVIFQHMRTCQDGARKENMHVHVAIRKLDRELSLKPRLLSGSEILLQVESKGILTQYRLDDLKERHRRQVERQKAGPRTHKKNVCDNVLWTILGVAGKSKDNVNARHDLQEMNIRKPLHLWSRGSNKACLPPAQFTMTKDEKYLFLKMLKDVRVPDGYSSNISRRVRLQDRSISGLKSHDSHILMQ